MKAVVIIVAVVLVAVGVMFNRVNPKVKEEGVKLSEVLSEQTSPTEKPESASPTESLGEVLPTATPTPTKVIMKGNISDYRYPNSEILSSGQNALSLKSFDDAKAITNWYKQKIIDEGINVKTFVETKTNDNILNKLVGADGQKEIRVEIKKDAGTSFIQIAVSLKTTS